MSVDRGSPMTQAQMDALAGLANDHLAQLGSPAPFAFTTGNWLTELNRLRNAIFTHVITPDPYNPAYCFGPWAMNGDGIAKAPLGSLRRTYSLFREVVFYFRQSETPSVYTSAQVGSNPLGRTILANLDQTNAGVTVLTGTFKIKFSHDGDVQIGTVRIDYTNPDPLHGVSMMGSSDIPGATFHDTSGGPPFYFTVPAQALAAGEYTFNVSLTSEDPLAGNPLASVYPIDPVPTYVSSSVPTISLWHSASTSAAAPEGICKAQAIKKISAGEIPSGYGIQLYVPDINPITLDITYTLAEFAQLGFTASSDGTNAHDVPGIWVAKGWPISEVIVQDTLRRNLATTTKYSPRGAHYMTLPAPDPATEQIATVEPAVGFRPPRYPSFRDTETVPTGGQWDIWQPAGWQIMSWSARLLPVNDSKFPVPLAEDLEVAVGYMRAGNFITVATATIPAGALSTGTQYVTWPIFDATPLAWQCARGIFLAATAGLPIGDLTEYRAAQPPILAAHYNDLEAVLNTLP